MQHGWRSITRELGCDPDDYWQVFDAMSAALARRWWAGDESELELAEITRGVVRSDPSGSRLRPHLTWAGPDPAGDDLGVPEHDGGLP
jgi:hypothetical protein